MKVVVIGAGFGGLGCARALSNPPMADVDVTIVDAKDAFTIGGTWQYAWSGRVADADTTWKLEDAKANFPGVTWKLRTRVEKLVLYPWDDSKLRHLLLSDGEELTFDVLVLSPGVVGDAAAIPGMSDTLDVYAHDSIAKQRRDLERMIAAAKARQRAHDADADADEAGAKKKKKKKGKLAIAIGATPYKCPVAPFEVAFIADDAFRAAGCRDEIDIVVTSPVPWPLPDPAKEIFTRLMLEKGVEYVPEKKIKRVTDDGRCLEFDDDDQIAADVVWSVYPQIAPPFIHAAGLAAGGGKGPIGFVPVDPRTNLIGPISSGCELAKEGLRDVYCVGDCASVVVGGLNPKPQPKAGEFAWQMGEMVAHRILKTEGYAHSRVGACIAECGGGGGVLVKPDFTEAVADPGLGAVRVSVEEKAAPEGEDAKMAWVNKYVELIFGGKGRAFVAATKAA